MGTPWENPETGVYMLRKQVPKDLQKIVGKKTRKISLRTRDPKEAKLRYVKVSADLDKQWANLRRGVCTISERDAFVRGRYFFDHLLEKFGENPSKCNFFYRDYCQLCELRFSEVLWCDHPKFGPIPPDFDGQGFGPRSDAKVAISPRQKAFLYCRENVDEYLRKEGLTVDNESRHNLIREASRQLRKASDILVSLAKGDRDFSIMKDQEPKKGDIDKRS